MIEAASDGSFVRHERTASLANPTISIDYAVICRMHRAALVRVDMGWSDVGSWGALWEIADHDAAGNAVQRDDVVLESANCLVRVSDGPAVGVIGVSDLVVVSTRGSVLVIPRNRSQDVGAVVDELHARNSTPLSPSSTACGGRTRRQLQESAFGPSGACGGGVMIMGSHNPPTYNGFKLMVADRPFYGADIQALSTMAAAGDWATGAGTPKHVEIIDRYVDRRLTGLNGNPFTIASDCGNGVAGPIVERLVTRLP